MRARFQKETYATKGCCEGQLEDSGTYMTIRMLITVGKSEIPDACSTGYQERPNSPN